MAKDDNVVEFANKNSTIEIDTIGPITLDLNNYDMIDFIVDGGHGTGFCIGNVLKYAQRYGKKGSHADARKDLMKVLHYALIQLHIHDTQEEE